jgi:hypothetical protein
MIDPTLALWHIVLLTLLVGFFVWLMTRHD